MNPTLGKASSRSPKLVYVISTAKCLFFFRDSIADLCSSGFDVSVISSPGPGKEAIHADGASVFDVSINREISPLQDIVSLWRLWNLLRRIRPDITNVATPKGGLLGGLAAAFAGVPHRIYTLHGLRLETTHGLKRHILWCAEWLACKCAHQVYCVSNSLLELALDLRLVAPSKASVVANGTAIGIDCERFAPTSERREAAHELRARLGIDSKAPVVGFVGRLTRDKGIPELYQALLLLRTEFSDLHLLLVGDFETGDPVPQEIRTRIDHDPSVIQTGWVTDATPYYHIMNVFAFPTHREGFGLVSAEAQASGVPVVATIVTGARDSIVDGITGFATPVGDARALAGGIAKLLRDAELRRRMGDAGRDWVARTFDRRVVLAELKKLYIEAVPLQGTQNGRTWKS